LNRYFGHPRYGSDRNAPLLKSGAGRSATAGMSTEKLAEEGERTTKKSVPDQTRTNDTATKNPNRMNPLKKRRSGWRDCASARLQDASCTGVQNGG
jgi:hypothetical protein